MPYPANSPQRGPNGVPALLAANRLEARPRSAEFNRALRAEVRDPTWLLARQWQLHEFRAEDRGTPASVRLVSRELPLGQLAVGSQAARAYDPLSQPLEAAVEAQPRVIGLGLRLQMGQYWLRQLRSALRGAASTLSPTDLTARLAGFAQAFGVVAQPAGQAPVAHALAASQAETQALLTMAGPLALDGYALYQALLTPFLPQLGAALADNDQLLALLQQANGTPRLPLAQHLLDAYPAAAQAWDSALPLAALEAAAVRFVGAFHRLYLLGEASDSWSTEAMAYRFAAGAAEGQGLGSTHYEGGAALPWYAVDARPAPAGGGGPPGRPAGPGGHDPHAPAAAHRAAISGGTGRPLVGV
jgi:hypothetical protein